MGRSRLLTSFVASLVTTVSFAVVPPEDSPLRRLEFRHPDLDYRNIYRPLAELPVDQARRLGSELSRLGVDPSNAYYDRLTGRWGTLVFTQPLIPGPGVGNSLQWSDLGFQEPPGGGALGEAAAQAFTSYLAHNAAELRIDPAELTTPRVRVFGERVIQLHVGRQIDGIPVRGAFVSATINSGNLVLMGEREWGEPTLETQPSITGVAAEASLAEHLEGFVPSGFRKEPRLEILPVASWGISLREPDAGLRHRLAWVLTPEFADDTGGWEALVDAHSGELLAFQDTNHYASRRVEGWIFPVSNDGNPPDGELVPGFPMPFADLALDGEPLGFTSTGGNVPPGADTGTISTALSGRYLHMNDECGVIDESAATGDLDLEGVPGGTDCEVPPGHSPGDTNATRSGFYELNRIIEQGRGYLPDNGWLNGQLTANMNLNQTCNAFWNGSVNFFRSGGGCSNTGELAGVFDHEWGHGMDNNDATGSISNPGEGIADIYAANRLNTSCMGRNFRPGVVCGGYGDPCTECTGVRDIDWEKRQSGQPHDVAWIDANCGSGGGTPCGGSTHCEGAVYAEAVWDFVHRDLMDGAPFDLDLNTALELGTRLTYSGSSNVGNWFQCTTDGTGGCNADGGYLNYLAVDDDNGDLTDGTPHMTAIFAAFDRHQIACPTPTAQNSGCAGGPTTAPANVVATPINEGAHLTWDAVAGASEYWIYRTEGVHGCDFGKTLVGKTTSTEFVEFGLRNGFEVLYGVVAVGDNDACTGPMSTCQAVSPVEGPGLGFDPSAPEWAGQTGDGDGFFDNCETGTLTFQVSNTGTGALTDVRIIDASITSHPEAEILTDLPASIAANLPEGESAAAELLVLGGGFEFNDTLTLEVTVTSDELDPLAIPHTYSLAALESDLQAEPSLTFSFEAGEDGWQLVSGIFDRTDAPPGGANGTDFYRASSDGLDQQCDRIRSPLVELTETSTLELYNQFDIEDMSGGFWWDRANVGVFDPLTGDRAVVSPDGGRLYNASGSNAAPAPCASAEPPDAPGWASDGPDWVASTWTADALGSPDLAGQLIQLDVAYGTDPAVTGDFGFWFDEVTLTDVNVQVPDAQSDVCAGAPVLSFDPSSLDFGDVDVGTTSPPQTAMLHNTGDTDATGVTFSGLPDAGFEADTSACGDTLPAGGSCAVSVTFTPAVPGPATATLHVDSDEGAAADLGLSGNGVGDGEGPIADIQCDPLDFEVPQGGSDSAMCNVGNPGDADLTWSIEEAEPIVVPEGAPYRYGLAEMPAFNAPVGSSRATAGLKRPASVPADPVVMPAPQAAAIGSFTEGFDDITTLPGAGWALINNSEPVGPSSWFQGNETIFPSHEGAPDAYIAANFESTDDAGDISNWLLTPEVTIVNGTTACFWTRTSEQFEEFYDRLEVRMSIAGDSTDVGDTADSVGDFTDLLLSINPDLEPNEYPEEWTEFCVTVRERSREPVTGRFAFRYWVTDSGPDGSNGDYIGIDTVSVTQPDDVPPTGCDNPVDVPWLTENPNSGTTPPGGSEPVDVSVNAAGLEIGEHEALLCFTTNDPNTPLVEVPVNLTVTEGGEDPVIDVDPDSLESTLPEGGTETHDLTISNLGGGSLDWEVTLDGAAGLWTPRSVKRPSGAGLREPTRDEALAGVTRPHGARGTGPDPSRVSVPAYTPTAADEAAGIDRSPSVGRSGDPWITGKARSELLQGGVLLVPNTGSDHIVALDPETGDVLDPNFISIENISGGAKPQALLHPDGQRVLISAQTQDVVHAYDLETGDYLGVFAPAGGADPSIMDNIRGIVFHPTTGYLLVSSDGGGNSDSVVEFDAEGNFLGLFIDSGAGGISSPWSLIFRDSDALLSNGIGDGIYSFGHDGTFIELWEDDTGNLTNFPEQIAEIGNGNVLAATFSSPSGAWEFDSAGALIDIFDPVTGLRGVYALGNGNILVTDGGGVHEINRDNELVETKMAGSSYMITPVQTGGGDCALPTWVSVDPMSGSVPGGESQVVSVTFDATGLPEGTHTANLCIASNDPATPLVVVPLTLTVTPGQELACFEAKLSGDHEVPPVDTDHMGAGAFTYDFDTMELTWEVSHDIDLTEVVGAHIHVGAVGENGPIDIALDHTMNPIVGSATLTSEQEGNLTGELYYVNVHTNDFPGGEIRGQILPCEPEPGDGSLTTLFTSNNGFAGNTFDLEPLVPLEITGFDVNVVSDIDQTITIYWKEGTAEGFDSDPTAWTVLGSDVVTPAGQDQPTQVELGGLTLEPGNVYGFYVDLESYELGVSVLRYTDGPPTVFANDELSLTTLVGKAAPAFEGTTFPDRMWNGTVHYSFQQAQRVETGSVRLPTR